MNGLWILIARDCRLFAVKGGEGVSTVFFFMMVSLLFALSFGGEREMLQQAGAGVIWVSALLSSLLALEQIYHRDFDDGSLDLVMLSPVSPFCIALAKALSHWMVSGLPLFLASIVTSQMFFIDTSYLGVFLLSLLAGTVYMSLLGGFGAFLTMGSKKPGVLLALVVLPLYIPMLILGVMAAQAGLEGSSVKPYLLLQAALSLAALPLTLLASSSLLKMHLRSN